MKILFVAPLYPDRAPSQRFRFEQFLDYFEKQGIKCEYSNLVTPEVDKLFYSPGNILRKFLLSISFAIKRFKDLQRAKQYDIVFIQREAYYLGTSFFEKRFAKKTKVIYDFDDSIWIPNVSDANKKLNFLKNPQKTSKIISYSHLVFAGNQYLADYAKQFNDNVTIVPTTIDTDEYQRLEVKNEKIVIGWSGSKTTIQHFKTAVPFLTKVKEKYGDKVEIKVIGDAGYMDNVINVRSLDWLKKDEIKELSEFDIGIMPLPDDKWAKGKCGLKGLQYMALEIPTIMSPVGVNSDIIQDGENGFLAGDDKAWFEKISCLIESESLRKSMGAAGRKTVIEKYSKQAWKGEYVRFFQTLTTKS